MYHYYMFNKPFGCVTARKDSLYPTVMDYFSNLNNHNLSPVGRLDRETEGLLIITDDGKLNQIMTHPVYHKEKVYEFIAMGELTSEKKNLLEQGTLITGSDKLTKPAKIEITSTSTLLETLSLLHPEIQEKIGQNLPSHPIVSGFITITEGRKRQIRRMFKSVRCCIISLKRISIDNITLDNSLKPGEFKEINKPNIKSTFNH